MNRALTIGNPITKHVNGDFEISIYADGTKVREQITDSKYPSVDYPESIDLKITDKCERSCEFCHENSSISGKHGDIKKIIANLKSLPAGTELAIGGGNPLLHPELKDFLVTCKYLRFIPSITVNYLSILWDKKQLTQLNTLIDDELIYGVGVSLPVAAKGYTEDIIHSIHGDNVVIHIIAGIHRIDDILSSIIQTSKVLILGYKDFGRGVTYKENIDQTIPEKIEDMRDNLYKLFNNPSVRNLSFDNLAIKQLDVKSHLTDKKWEEFYMGDDGIYTMYYDGVEQEYAMSSTSDRNLVNEYGDIVEFFKVIRGYNEKG